MKRVKIIALLTLGLATSSYAEGLDDVSFDAEVYVKADSAKKAASLKLKKDIMRVIRSAMSDGKFSVFLRKERVTKDIRNFLEDLDYRLDMDYNEDFVEVSWK